MTVTQRELDTRFLDRELVLENSWLKERVKTLQAEVKQQHELVESLPDDVKRMESEQMGTTVRFIYIAIKPCGCIVAGTAIDPRWAKHTAQAVAGWIRDGLSVERVPVGDDRLQCQECTCAHHRTGQNQREVSVASELDRLKAAMKQSFEDALNGEDTYLADRVDAVIAHLEGELTKSFETIKRCNLNMADMERDLYLKMQDVESRLAECQERERKLREACEEASEYFEERLDVVDGSDGTPRANREMLIHTTIETAMGRKA